jgi:hypothetical protein
MDLGPDELEAVRIAAKKTERSLAGFVRAAIKEKIARINKGNDR